MIAFRLFVLAASLAVADRAPVLGETEPAAATPPLPAGDVISDPAHDPHWRELFDYLSTPKARVSQFEERRYFPFREKPVVLTGEIRLLPGHGLSISYQQPKPQILIIDRAGVLMRDDRGRQRAAPNDSRAQAASSALFQILQFDWPALQDRFEVRGVLKPATAVDNSASTPPAAADEHATGAPAQPASPAPTKEPAQSWTLTFTPRDAALAGLIGSVVVDGEDHRLNRIELNRADHQRIEILLQHTMDDVIFSEEVVKKFFR